MEQWPLDGADEQRRISNEIIPFSSTEMSKEHNFAPYLPIANSIPLIPRIKYVSAPNAASFLQDGSLIKLGSKIFRKSPGDGLDEKTNLVEIIGRSDGDHWEETCLRGPFIVACRRRSTSTRNGLSKNTSKDRRRVCRLLRVLIDAEETHSRSLIEKIRSGTYGSHLTSQLEQEMNRAKHPDANISSGASSSGGSIHSASEEESWSEGIDGSEDDSGEEIASEKEDSDEDFDLEASVSVDDNSSILSRLSESEYDSDETHSNASEDLSDVLDAFEDDVSSNASARNPTIPSNPPRQDQASSADLDLSNHINDSGGESKAYCNGCAKQCSEQYYHCVECFDSNFDLCERCKQRGRWCLDLDHQLQYLVKGETAAVISRHTYDPRQELIAYRTGSAEAKTVVFHFQRKHPVLLHDSPPVIHDKHPLVVWPLAGDTLLFSDLSRNKSFEQKLTPSSLKRGHSICVSLSFSPCGSILRMASIEAVPELPKGESVSKNGKSSKLRLCLYLHVLLFRFSSNQPERKRPKLVTSASYRLGCSFAQAFVPTLPFAFTWGASDLYLTISGSALELYHASFPDFDDIGRGSKPVANEKTTKESLIEVMILRKTLQLPHPQNRSVQFFPPLTPGTEATVIIDPSPRPNSTPPLAMYLSMQGFGGWMNLKEKGGGAGVLMTHQMDLENEF